MGKVTVQIKLQNSGDLELLAAGKRKRSPRTVVTDALVDTGATRLYLKASIIQHLGLRELDQVQSLTMSNRREPRRVFSAVDIEIQGRSGTFRVIELPNELPNVVGQIPLEEMDWVVDLKNRKLIPNPEHKDGVMCEDF